MDLLSLLLFASLMSTCLCLQRTQHRANYWQKLASVQGPNVCAFETTPKQSLTYNYVWSRGRYCGTKTIVKFHCCSGYEMVPGEEGCPMTKQVKSVLQTASMVNAGKFVRMQETAGLNRWAEKENEFAITVLAPHDKSLKMISPVELDQLNYTAHRTPGYSSAPDLLAFHTLQGRIELNSSPQDFMYSTALRNSEVRINIYPGGLVTVNCIPVVNKNLKTSHGLLHTLSKPLSITPSYPIADVLSTHPLLQRIATFVTGDIISFLRREGPFTFLAPTDDAFRDMPIEDLRFLLQNRHIHKEVISYLLVPRVYCSASLMDIVMRNSAGANLRVHCDQTGISVNSASVVEADIMASNGVIHLIDKVILPRKARALHQLLPELNISIYQSLFINAGLQAYLEEYTNYTIFAPSDDAFNDLGNDTLQILLSNPSEARRLLLSHIASGQHLVSHMLDSSVLTSLRFNRKMLIKYFNGKVLVNSAQILSKDIIGRDGVIHVINKVLPPETKTVIDYLKAQGGFTKFIEALNLTSPSLLKLLSSSKEYFTLFAVTDNALNYWPADLFVYDRMMADTRIVNTIMRNHIVLDTIYTTALSPGGYTQLSTLNPEPLLLKRWLSPSGPTYAGNALVQKGNIPCVNGVVHIVNRLIQIPNPSYF